jgi:hypothetical protein
LSMRGGGVGERHQSVTRNLQDVKSD